MIDCFKASLHSGEILFQMFSLLLMSVISEAAISVVEMFLLRMTAASDLASTLNCTF